MLLIELGEKRLILVILRFSFCWFWKGHQGFQRDLIHLTQLYTRALTPIDVLPWSTVLIGVIMWTPFSGGRQVVSCTSLPMRRNRWDSSFGSVPWNRRCSWFLLTIEAVSHHTGHTEHTEYNQSTDKGYQDGPDKRSVHICRVIGGI